MQQYSITARDDQVTYFYWFEDNLFLSFTCIQTHKHKNQDTCSTEMWHHQVQWPAFVRLLCQITPTFTFFFLLASLDSFSLSYLSFFTYFPSSIPPFSSYLPFILCPSSHSSLLSPLCSQTNSLLDATWDTVSSPVPRFSLSLCFYASLSFRGPQAKPSPLPLSGCHRFLSTLIVPRTHYLSHTPKHKYNVLIFTYNMQHLDKMLF